MEDYTWIILLDNIKAVCFHLAPLSVFVFAIAAVTVAASFWAKLEEDTMKYAKWLAAGGIVSFLAAFLLFSASIVGGILPSTKQAATIAVLNRYGSEENLDKLEGEAKHLYDLSKEWLKEEIEKGKDN